MNEKTIVLTMYGTGKSISDISISLLGDTGVSFYSNRNGAKDFCLNINTLELKDENWVYATAINEHQKIRLERPGGFIDFGKLASLDDRAVQMVLREIDPQELAKALKSADKDIFRVVLRNMTKRAAKMLIEDMEYMGPVRIKDVEEARQKIGAIIHHLEYTGEIVVPTSQDKTV